MSFGVFLLHHLFVMSALMPAMHSGNIYMLPSFQCDNICIFFQSCLDLVGILVLMLKLLGREGGGGNAPGNLLSKLLTFTQRTGLLIRTRMVKA